MMITCFEKNCLFDISIYCERLLVCVCVSYPVGIIGWMWDLTVIVPAHCLSFILISWLVVIHWLFETMCYCRSNWQPEREVG